MRCRPRTVGVWQWVMRVRRPLLPPSTTKFASSAKHWPAIPVSPISHLPCRAWAREQFPISARMNRSNAIFLAWRMVLPSRHLPFPAQRERGAGHGEALGGLHRAEGPSLGAWHRQGNEQGNPAPKQHPAVDVSPQGVCAKRMRPAWCQQPLGRMRRREILGEGGNNRGKQCRADEQTNNS